MICAAASERRRLDALNSYGVLDTPPEASFDRFTELAAHLFNAPIALISLVDEHRQWFKSAVGLEVRSTPRDQAFCTHVLGFRKGEVLVVEDATQDARFASSPLVLGPPHVRFYAGAVLTNSEGYNLGTLCVIDTIPRARVPDRALTELRALAEMVVDHLEGRRARLQLQEQQALVAQTALFENAFHHAPIGFALVDLRGRFMKVNAAFAGIVGYSEAELLAADFQRITHPDDLDRDEKLRAQLTAGEIPNYQMDKRYVRKNGRPVWANLSVSLVRNPDGSPKHYISQVQDLTARMEAEARYKLMAETARDMIVTTDMHGRTTFVSASCRAITGWTPAEAVGRRFEEYTHPDDLPVLRDAFTRIVAGEPSRTVRWRGWNRATESWTWLESSPSVLTESDEPCFVDVVRDITDQVAQEEALALARQEAEAAAAAKAEFLANMSHEIRTPLTAVVGFGGLLCERDDLSPEARQFADRILTAGHALMSVVNGVLDFSKLEAGEVEIKPRAVDPRQMAHEILGLFQPQADAKSLTLRLAAEEPVPPLVMVDPQGLRQILFNLIGNAMKFTDAGSVTLRLAHRKDRLMVAVEDSGPGIALEQQSKLFQRFSQVDGSSTRRHGGTGLGLAICKGLVEAMGGQIGVRSALGRGSTFHFEIGAPIAAASAGPEAAPAFSIEGLRVLLADDNPVNRELARAILESLGGEVREATDGVEAVDLAQSTPFDLILMDMRMPRLDGPGAVRRIRSEQGPNCEIPILAFSAGDPSRIDMSGLDGAAPKPITPASLLKAIGAAFDARAARQDDRDVAHA